MGWVIAQLGHDTMGNCIVTQQVLGVQVGWGRACHDRISCIVTGGGLIWLGESVSRYTMMYHGRSEDLAVGVTIQLIVS